MTSLPRLPKAEHLLAYGLLLIVCAMLTYGSSLGNGFVQWDDPLLITENPAVRVITPASVRWIFTHYDPELYIPLTFLGYQIDWLIGGGSAFVFHLHSLALHVLNALLTAWLLLLLLGRRSYAAMGGLLFLLHPLHTEAVAWASGRKDVLSTAFVLGACISYLYAAHRNSTALRSTSIVLHALGLLAKVMAITLPAVLLLCDAWQGRLRGSVRRLWPYVALSVVFGIVAIGGKTEIIERSGPLETLLMAMRASVQYLRMFFVPTGLTALYPHIGGIDIAQPVFFLPIIVLALIVAGALLLRRRIPAVLFGLSFFFVTVAPTFLNFAKEDLYIGSDRYAYLPSVGLLAATLALIAWLLDRLSPRTGHAAGMIAGVVVLCIAMPLTRAQSLTWHDTESLFLRVIEAQPRAHVAYVNLGNAYRRSGDDAKAIEMFESALAIRPHAKTEANLGAVYRKLGRYGEARTHFERALALDATSAEAAMGLGLLEATVGRADAAETAYRQAMESDPSYGEAAVNLAVLLHRYGRSDEALALLEDTVRKDPLLADAQYNLAVLYMAFNRNDDAIDAYRRALALEPNAVAARINLALLLAQRGERDGAIEQFRAILQIDPENVSARAALEQLGATR